MTRLVKAWSRQTHGPLVEITKHFFDSLIRSESFAGDESFTTSLVQILGLLIAASWFLPVFLFRRYIELHGQPDPARYFAGYSSDCLWVMTLMMLLMGLVTILEWPALFPSHRDHFVLSPLPITRLQLFGGKLLALVLFFSVFLLAIVSLSSLALPLVSEGRWETRAFLWRAVALFLGSAGTGYFVFLSLLGIQGLLLAFLPLRWFSAVSFAIQMALFLAILCALFVLPYLPTAQLIRSHSPWIACSPSGIFWSWTERAIGNHDPFVSTAAARAPFTLLVAVLTAAVTYSFYFLRYARHALETPRKFRPILQIGERTAHLFRHPEARAVSAFVTHTLLRGRQQKLIFCALWGFGLALIFENFVYLALHDHSAIVHAQLARTSAFTLPLTLSFFSSVALRRVFRIPIDAPANWLFRFREYPSARASQLNAVFGTFVVTAGILPILLCAPLECYVLGRQAYAAVFAQILLAFILGEYLFAGWNSIPFTFVQEAPRRHLIHSLCVHLLELTIFSGLGSTWIDASIHDPRSYAFLLIALALAFIALHLRRIRSTDGADLQFLDAGTPAVEPLLLARE